MPSAEADVLAANQSFYEAFARSDFAALDALWARRAPVACIHPGWDALIGRAKVMASFRAILEGPAPPPIKHSRASAHILGETAFVTCLESIPGARLIATNIFTREEDSWKLVHHQAGPVSESFNVSFNEPPPDTLN